MDYSQCIQACLACFKACTICAQECLNSKTHTECIKKCLTCADVCIICAKICTRQGEFIANFCSLCAIFTQACAKECSKFDDPHCQKSAEVCIKCMNECEAVI